MTQASSSKAGLDSKPLVVTRTFAAPRSLVFKAWSTAEHMKRWFCPEGFTVPEAEIDFRPGGTCTICMRSPAGQDMWSRGKYIEVSPPERLVFTSEVANGMIPAFTAHTTVTFEAEGPGTRMTVRQVYDIHDENFRFAIEGASEGWRTTLDKLEQEIARMQNEPGAGSVAS
ncbi:MAG: SRPBCC domain-containing protein [Methylobacteriaceae bacterium]|nr:SRPBCC domain-containing protein [Methylobacteriaceae bacterium]